ncbi:MAG: amidohydrolase [Candidatus Bathyarchaeia archaeon]
MSHKSKEDILSWITENKPRIIEISDKIWELAEVGLQEFKSSSLLADELKEAGFTVQSGVAGMPTAFVATYGTGKPTIGVLGEYDALPGLSQKPISKNEPLTPGAPGHGCGHNIHGASGMAGAIATRMAMEASGIKGAIKFFGCPAEETLVGKVFMVRDGLFDGVDAVLSHHPSSMNAATLISSNAMNSVKFHFYGRAAHAASSPDQGRGAIDAVELMNMAANYMREHIVQEARVHYVIEDGGHEPNVIPAYARSWYYVRAPEREQVESIYRWILNIAEGADLMAGTTHEVEFLTGCYNRLSNRRLSELIVKNMREIGAPTYTAEELAFAREISETIPPEEKRAAIKRSKRPGWKELLDIDLDRSIPDPWGEGEVMGGSTDVGDVSWQTPTVEFATTSCVLGTPGHSWQRTAMSGMSIGHKSLIFAAKTIAATALDLLTNPDVLKEVRDEFVERTRGIVYKSPLPPELKPPLDQLPPLSTGRRFSRFGE